VVFGIMAHLHFNAMAQVETASEVIEKMYKTYEGKWYEKITFRQITSFYKNDSLQKEETWHEALETGEGLVIKFESKDSGDGIMFKKDSMYVFKEGKLVNETKRIHELLVLGFDVYLNDSKQTINRLIEAGIDFSHFEETDHYYLIGNSNTKQVWIDKQTLLFFKIESYKDGVKSRTEFRDYRPIGGGWIAAEVLFYRNDQLYIRETYFDIESPATLPANLFDTKNFTSVKW